MSSSLDRLAFPHDPKARPEKRRRHRRRASEEDSRQRRLSTVVDEPRDVDMEYDPRMPPPKFPASAFAPVYASSSSSSISGSRSATDDSREDLSWSSPHPPSGRSYGSRSSFDKFRNRSTLPLSDSDSGIMFADSDPKSCYTVRAAQRPPSVRSRSSSQTSCQTKATIPRSILSRHHDESPRIRRSPTPHSVKFVDVPTVHYDVYQGECDAHLDVSHPSTPPSSPSKPGLLKRLARLASSSKAKTGSSSSRPSDGRPSISGPYPLGPPPLSGGRAHARGTTTTTGRAAHAPSLRSVASNSSMRSGRLRTFWDSFVS